MVALKSTGKKAKVRPDGLPKEKGLDIIASFLNEYESAEGL